MKSILIILSMLLAFMAHAQVREQPIEIALPAERYEIMVRSDAVPQQPEIHLEPHNVERGETLEAILEARSIRFSPRAIGLVLDVNPDLHDANRIREGEVLLVPAISNLQLDAPSVIGSPAQVRLAHDVSATLSKQARTIDDVGSRLAIERYSQTLELSADPFSGLSARALAAWSAQGEAVAILSERGDLALAAELANEGADGLEQTMELARLGQSTMIEVTVEARDSPTDEIPPGCRIRYSYWGFAHAGHEVRPDRVMDFSMSDCEKGKERLDSWVTYGLWAEWQEDDALRRSRIKRVTVTPGIDGLFDLPLQPFE